MKKINCNTCGESTYLIKQVDTKMEKETPRDHLARTGHDPRMRAGERRACESCGNVWWYHGDGDRPTCPECKGKRTSTTDAHDITDEQAELLRTVPQLREDLNDELARTFVIACNEIREGYLSGAAADLNDVASRLKEEVDE